jgi:hypothetical protein
MARKLLGAEEHKYLKSLEKDLLGEAIRKEASPRMSSICRTIAKDIGDILAKEEGYRIQNQEAKRVKDAQLSIRKTRYAARLAAMQEQEGPAPAANPKAKN